MRGQPSAAMPGPKAAPEPKGRSPFSPSRPGLQRPGARVESSDGVTQPPPPSEGAAVRERRARKPLPPPPPRGRRREWTSSLGPATLNPLNPRAPPKHHPPVRFPADDETRKDNETRKDKERADDQQDSDSRDKGEESQSPGTEAEDSQAKADEPVAQLTPVPEEAAPPPAALSAEPRARAKKRRLLWGVLLPEEQEQVAQSEGTWCPLWGHKGCKKWCKADVWSVVQHLETKHHQSSDMAVRNARRLFGLPPEVPDEPEEESPADTRLPAEPVGPPPRARGLAVKSKPRPPAAAVAQAVPTAPEAAPTAPLLQPKAEASAQPVAAKEEEQAGQGGASSSSTARPATAPPEHLALLKDMWDTITTKVLR